MDIGTFAQAAHDAATSEKTGVIALVTSVVTILGGGAGLWKALAEIRKIRAEVPKLASETTLNTLKAEQVKWEIRKLGGQEIQNRLDSIRSNARDLYNQIYDVYEPCLSRRAKLTKPQVNKIEHFVNERKYITEIKPAVNYLRQCTESHDAPALTHVVEVGQKFLSKVGASKGQSFLERITDANGKISREFSAEMKIWMDEVRILLDELASSTGISTPESRFEFERRLGPS